VTVMWQTKLTNITRIEDSRANILERMIENAWIVQRKEYKLCLMKKKRAADAIGKPNAQMN